MPWSSTRISSSTRTRPRRASWTWSASCGRTRRADPFVDSWRRNSEWRLFFSPYLFADLGQGLRAALGPVIDRHLRVAPPPHSLLPDLSISPAPIHLRG